jgi:glycogen phosphorylase
MNDVQELNRAAQATPTQGSLDAAALLKSYAISAALFSGSPDALYERHLKFDNIVEPETANTRERYKAAARAVRDILSDRWLRTYKTYARENPKRVYYVSIEFLIGRSLGNNVMNLLLDPIVGPSFKGDGREWWEILHEEPDAGLGNGGLGRLAACFLDSMATMQLPAMGYGLRYEHGIFQQKNSKWLAGGAPGQLARSSRSLGDRAAGGKRPSDVRLHIRTARRQAAHDPEQAFDPHRRPL